MLANTASRSTWACILIVLSVDIITRHSFQDLVSNNQITVIFYQPSHTDIQKDINLNMRDRERAKVSESW